MDRERRAVHPTRFTVRTLTRARTSFARAAPRTSLCTAVASLVPPLRTPAQGLCKSVIGVAKTMGLEIVDDRDLGLDTRPDGPDDDAERAAA